MKGNDFITSGYPFEDPENMQPSDEFAELMDLMAGYNIDDVEQIDPTAIRHWKQHYEHVELEHDAIISRINTLMKVVDRLREAGQDLLADIYVMKAEEILDPVVYKNDVYERQDDKEYAADIDHITEKYKEILMSAGEKLGSQVMIKIESFLKFIAKLNIENAINIINKVKVSFDKLLIDLNNEISKVTKEETKDKKEDRNNTEMADTKTRNVNASDLDEEENNSVNDSVDMQEKDEEFVELAKTDLFGKIQEAIREEMVETEDEFSELDTIDAEENDNKEKEKTKTETSLTDNIEIFDKTINKDSNTEEEISTQLEQELENRILQTTETSIQTEENTAKRVFADNIIFIETTSDIDEAVSDIERSVFVSAGDTPLAEIQVIFDPEFTRITFGFSGVSFTLLKEDNDIYIIDTSPNTEADKTDMTTAIVKKVYLDDIEEPSKGRFEIVYGDIFKIEKGRKDKYKVTIENIEDITQDELLNETGIVVEPFVGLTKMFGDRVDLPEFETYESGDLYEGLSDQEKAELSDI